MCERDELKRNVLELVKSIIDDCNGHPRTLQRVYSYLNKATNDPKFLHYKYEDLIAGIADTTDCKYSYIGS